MKDPSPSAQALLSRYKSSQSLGATEKSRLAEVVRERALRGDLPRFDIVAQPPTVPEPSWWARVWASSLGKAAVGLTLAALPAASIYQLSQSKTPSPAPVAAASAASLAAEPPEQTPPPSIEVEAAPTLEPKIRREKPAAAASASEATIDGEVQLLNAAQTALRGGDPQGALRLLGEHAARFPSGKLASARQVTRMMALCQSGQAKQARLEAEQFVSKNPSSPFVDRVQAICQPARVGQ